jgi:hypothetical protein
LELGISLAAASSFSLVLDTSATAKPPCERLAAAAPTPGPYLIRTHTFMVGLASVVTVAKRERERERAMERLVVALVEEGRDDGCEWRWSVLWTKSSAGCATGYINTPPPPV